MNKKFSQLAAYPLVLSLALSLASIPVVAQTVYVDGIDAAFPPFSFINAQGDAEGFDVDVVRWIAEEMGFALEIVPVDWDAIVPTLKLGTIDLIASGMTITQERLEQVAFTDPYWSIELAVVVRETIGSNGEPVNEKNLFTAIQAGQRVGVQRGTTSQSWLEENVIAQGIAVEVVLYDNFLLALDDLEIGRITSAVMDEPTALSAISGSSLAVAGTIATGEIYGYAVRTDDSELLTLLNEGLRRIQASSAWDELVAKWLIGQ
ncbi:transporter substrate-binding domain-containing protein [Candidatus Bipolaricaulota bacterium]|nr:transporter substrate-binding domain-containing protein [Candidatus Bipolaricaulota bacterium]